MEQSSIRWPTFWIFIIVFTKTFDCFIGIDPCNVPLKCEMANKREELISFKNLDSSGYRTEAYIYMYCSMETMDQRLNMLAIMFQITLQKIDSYSWMKGWINALCILYKMSAKRITNSTVSLNLF